MCVVCVCVCSAVTSWPQSATAAAVRDEPWVDQMSCRSRTGTKQSCCPGTHQPSTTAAAAAEQVTTLDSVPTMPRYFQTPCVCIYFRCSFCVVIRNIVTLNLCQNPTACSCLYRLLIESNCVDVCTVLIWYVFILCWCSLLLLHNCIYWTVVTGGSES